MEKIKGYAIIVFCDDYCVESYRVFLAENLQQAKNFIESKLAKRNSKIKFFNNGNGEFEKYFVYIKKNGENAFKDFNGFDIREVWVEPINFFKHNKQYFFQTQKDEICQLNY